MAKLLAKSKVKSWTRLDNAGKIFPPTTTKRDTKVFRVSCELYEDIDRGILEIALEKTLESYPVYRNVLKRGMFWYYLEASAIEPKIEEENKPPCAPLYVKNRKNLLFEVTYYKKRINLEVYHSLSDGTGALEFLKTLVTHYLVIKYKDEYAGKKGLFCSVSSNTQKNDDSFNRYFSKDNMQKRGKRIKAHTIKTPITSENRLSVIEAVMPLDVMLKVAKEKGTTLTVLLTSLFLCSINRDMTLKERKRPVVAVVPVNLRNYFESESVRNFFGTINVGYNFTDFSDELDLVIQSVKKSFEQELIIERLNDHMNMYSALEHNVFARPVPLFIKDLIMYTANVVSGGEKTVSISNVGKITMPEPIAERVNSFNVFVSTSIIQLCICSFKNNLNVTFSSAFVSTDIQMYFFRYLTALGVTAVLNANTLDDEQEVDS